MRLILLEAALAAATCSHPVPAEPQLVTAQEPAELLAEQIRRAFANHDLDAILNLAKWDGVREEHREIFDNIVGALVEQDIESVFLEPLGSGFEQFEHQGVLYTKNGEALGKVTISFAVEAPAVSEYLHWPYAVENGKAVILLDVPVAANVTE
jgi:hypothetical protein